MRHVRWTGEGRAQLEALLAKANQRRTTRLLSLQELELCAGAALASPLGYAWKTGGAAPDARALTTLCLAVVRGERLTLGVAAVHGAGTPASAWAELPDWQAYDDAENVPGLLAWSGRQRDDRVSFAVSPAPRGASRDELLAAVLARPSDDAPRLVLADLLTEQGDPRGEFIGCQIAGEHARATELLAEHGAQWLAPLTPEVARAEFSRGFLARVALLDSRALPLLAEKAEHEPLESLSVSSDRLFDAARFAAMGWTARLVTLVFSRAHGPGALSVEQLTRLLSSRHLRSLRELTLHGQRLGDAGARVLLERGPATLPGLERLAIERDGLTVTSARQIAASRWVAGLEELSLDDNELGPDGAEVLAVSRLASQHQVLSLSGNQLGNEGAIVLARARRFRGLRRLGLARNRISASGLDALLGSEPLHGLEALDLDGNPIGASGRERLRARLG